MTNILKFRKIYYSSIKHNILEKTKDCPIVVIIKETTDKEV